MAAAAADASDVEKLYEFNERLNEAKDKSEHVSDYDGIIMAAKGSTKAKQLAAQLIPRFFKFFPSLTIKAIESYFDLCEEEELGIRVQAIRGLPLLCKDKPDFVPKIVDVLGQLLLAVENVERDAVHKALMSLLRQDAKASLTSLFHHFVASGEHIRDKVLNFIKDKVFPLKTELLRPQDQMERHVTDLVKTSLQDVTGAEFKMFMDFLMSLNIFGDNAPQERMQELIEIIEEQADLDAQFNVSDVDHIDRLMSCMYMSVPLFTRGASNSKFLNYLNKHILPVFVMLPEERKVDLLKGLAESSPYTTPHDSRQLLPSIVLLLKKCIPQIKTEEMNFTHVECLLYTFHHLAHKAPNATNSLCGYKIVTGQPSDRHGEDFPDNYKDFTERLKHAEDMSRAAMKALTQKMADHKNALAAARTDDDKAEIKMKKQNTMSGLRTCSNILAMAQPLHLKSPAFIGDKKVSLSWKEPAKPASSPAASGVKRPASAAANVAGTATAANKKGRAVICAKNRLLSRALEGLTHGGSRNKSSSSRGRGTGYRWS